MALAATSLRVSRGAVTSSSKVSAPHALRSSSWDTERARAVAITLSPRLRAARTKSRPRPDLMEVDVIVGHDKMEGETYEVPVINQTS